MRKMDFWRLGEAVFFGGTSLAIWGLISGVAALQYFGMGLIVGSYPFLITGVEENE